MTDDKPKEKKEKKKKEKAPELEVFSGPIIPSTVEGLQFKEISDLVIPSKFRGQTSSELIDHIREEFNTGLTGTIMTPSILYGKRIGRNQFRLVHRNNTPELVAFTTVPMRLKIYATGKTEEIGMFDATDPFFGAHGKWVVNVPPGQWGLASSSLRPLILGEGCHVFIDPNFTMRDQDDGRFVSQAAYLIQHKTITIVRVPQGKICKAWYGTQPLFLEARPQPYIVDSPLFRVEKKSSEEVFEEASSSVILHGSLKRLLPRTGEVAITYDNGHLLIFAASKDNRPIIISSPTHIHDGFLQTNIQTLVFPSEETKAARKADNPKDTASLMYEVFRTKDGLPIGVQLLVVFEISDPMLTLAKLPKAQIIKHIENLVVADMGAVVQQCGSSDFQSTDQTKTRVSSQARDETAPSAPEFIRFLQDEVKNRLAKDFREYGIDLVRLNIETPKILDSEVAQQVSKFSLITTQTNAEVSVLEKQFQIAQAQAAQKAEQDRIQAERVNQNAIAKAKAAAESSQVDAEAQLRNRKLEATASAESCQIAARAQLEAAKLEAEGIRIKAQAESEASQLRTQAAEKEASILDKFPAYSELRKAEVLASAMQGIKIALLPSNAIPMFNFGGGGGKGNDTGTGFLQALFPAVTATAATTSQQTRK